MHTNKVPIEEFQSTNFHSFALDKARLWRRQMNNTCGDPRARVLVRGPPRRVCCPLVFAAQCRFSFRCWSAEAESGWQ